MKILTFLYSDQNSKKKIKYHLSPITYLWRDCTKKIGAALLAEKKKKMLTEKQKNFVESLPS